MSYSYRESRCSVDGCVVCWCWVRELKIRICKVDEHIVYTVRGITRRV